MSRPVILSVLAALSVVLCAAVARERAPGPSPLAAPAAVVAAHARDGDLVVVYPHRWHFDIDAFGDIPVITVTEPPVDVRRFNRVFVVHQAVVPDPDPPIHIDLEGEPGSGPRAPDGSEADAAGSASDGNAARAHGGSGDDGSDEDGSGADVRVPRPGVTAGRELRLDPTRFAPRSGFGLLPALDVPDGSGEYADADALIGAVAGADTASDEGAYTQSDAGSGPILQRPLRERTLAVEVGDADGPVGSGLSDESPPVDEALEALLDEIRQGRMPVFETRAGAFTVELWQSRDAATPVADLADLLPTARVRLEPHDGASVDCPWNGDAFVCPERPWVRVERVADNFAGQPLRCVWSHPPAGADLVIEFPRVHGASHIEGWYAHTDYAAEIYTGSRTVFDIEVDRGSRRFTAPRDRGRRPLQWRLPRRHDGPLVLRVHAERPDVAHFCWDLRLVHRVGVR